MQKPGEFGPFKFLWKLKLEHDPKQPTALTQPILLDRIIGFRGFKSIAFVGDQLPRRSRDRHRLRAPAVEGPHQLRREPSADSRRHARCPGGLTAALTRPTAVGAGAAGRQGGGGGRGGRSGGGVGEPGKRRDRRWRPQGQGRGGGAPPGLPRLQAARLCRDPRPRRRPARAAVVAAAAAVVGPQPARRCRLRRRQRRLRSRAQRAERLGTVPPVQFLPANATPPD